MRKVLNHDQANYMIRTYEEVKRITDEGGVAYETKSAIWTFSPMRERVTLFVKNPSPMTNDTLDYTPYSKHYKLHRDRILRLTGAVPTAYTMMEDFRDTVRKWK